MWAQIFECSPLSLSVLPQHQRISQQFDGLWSVCWKVRLDGNWVPGFQPVENFPACLFDSQIRGLQIVAVLTPPITAFCDDLSLSAPLQ